MSESMTDRELRERRAALALDPEEFRSAGHALVDRIAEFLGGLPQRPVTTGESRSSSSPAISASPRFATPRPCCAISPTPRPT